MYRYYYGGVILRTGITTYCQKPRDIPAPCAQSFPGHQLVSEAKNIPHAVHTGTSQLLRPGIYLKLGTSSRLTSSLIPFGDITILYSSEYIPYTRLLARDISASSVGISRVCLSRIKARSCVGMMHKCFFVVFIGCAPHFSFASLKDVSDDRK